MKQDPITLFRLKIIEAQLATLAVVSGSAPAMLAGLRDLREKFPEFPEDSEAWSMEVSLSDRLTAARSSPAA